MHQNKKPFEIIKFKNSAGFGLIENILSGALLIILVTFSMYFISLRQKTIFNTNLTNAINGEIKRDIEILKSELKTYKLTENPEKDISIFQNDFINCNEDILDSVQNLEGWYPEQWNPGSNKNSRDGQIKNKIFKGSNVEIRRTLNKVNPLINEFEDENLDSSIAKIQYLVKTDKNKDTWKIWTNILLSNELKSYCAPL